MNDTEFNNIEKEKFINYTLDEDKTSEAPIPVRLNADERLWLNESKKILQQEKDSTYLKQLAKIGYEFVLHDPKTKLLLETIINNKRRNQRLGISEVE